MGIFTKDDLFKEMNQIRGYLNINYTDYPINIANICYRCNYAVLVETVPFQDVALRGMAVLASSENEQDIILLNNSRGTAEQNFDCGHELMHLCLHRNERVSTFNCFETVRGNQNSFLEWQANEGAAELLMPYKLIIPEFIRLKTLLELGLWLPSQGDIFTELSNKYNVPFMVAKNRIDNLSYEIYQHEQGVPLDRIEILSHKMQSKKGITPPDYRSYIDELWTKYIFSEPFCIGY